VASGALPPAGTTQMRSVSSPTNMRPSGRNTIVTAAAMLGTTTSSVNAGVTELTTTAGEVTEPPTPSCATAVSEWLPFVAVVQFQPTRYGAVVSRPMLTPSTKNSTSLTPTDEESAAWTAMTPPTTTPPTGFVTATVGGVGQAKAGSANESAAASHSAKRSQGGRSIGAKALRAAARESIAIQSERRHSSGRSSTCSRQPAQVSFVPSHSLSRARSTSIRD